MGLDQYLHRHIYVRNWKHMRPEELHTITVRQGGKIRKDINTKKISTIVEHVCSWRKANAIHKWFVDNVQEGVDDCKEYYVPRVKLKDLLDLVNKIIKKPELGKELLPCTDGFFYGSQDYDAFFFCSQDYDAWYMEDLKQTKEVLEEALKNETGSFYYSSNW